MEFLRNVLLVVVFTRLKSNASISGPSFKHLPAHVQPDNYDLDIYINTARARARASQLDTTNGEHSAYTGQVKIKVLQLHILVLPVAFVRFAIA